VREQKNLIGPLITKWNEHMKSISVTQIDISLGLSEMFAEKDANEIRNLRTSAVITYHLLKDSLLKEILETIDSGKQIKHSEISKNVEKVFEDPSSISKKVTSVIVITFPVESCICGLLLCPCSTKWRRI
jgi:nucleosome binding factor SPN SPT16 subunit